MRPNVLLVVLDTARADAFEPYGAPAGATPVVADLARRGRAVPMAISASNWTMPSHAAMFTGSLPRPLGLSVSAQGNGITNPREVIEANAHRFLPEVLRRAGYSTAGVSCNPWISEPAGFGTGFDVFRDLRGKQRRRPGKRWTKRLAFYLEAIRAGVDEGAAEAGSILRTRIRQGPATPFFWFANLMECHSPYLPAGPFNDLSPAGRLQAARDVIAYQRARPMVQYSLGSMEIPDEAMARMRHLYGRAVTSMDHWLGTVLEELDRRRMLEDTLVIVTSDHGENLGENHLLGHGLSLDQRLIHVPFVAAGPVEWPDRPLLSLTELPGILAELVGVDGHPWTTRASPEGTCIAQNDGAFFWPEEEVARLAHTWGIDPAIATTLGPYAAITDGRLKLYRDGEEQSLFDLERDPLETTDVSHAHPGEASRLAGILEGAQGTIGAGPAAAYSAEEQAEMEEHLEALGYL
jgi:arylsulfatase A-like enzyme